MAVGSGGIDVGAVGRAAQFVPATGEGGGASAVALKILSIGQGYVAARCTEGIGSPHTGITLTADGTHAEGVSRVGGETCDSAEGIGDNDRSVVTELVLPLGGCARLNP